MQQNLGLLQLLKNKPNGNIFQNYQFSCLMSLKIFQKQRNKVWIVILHLLEIAHHFKSYLPYIQNYKLALKSNISKPWINCWSSPRDTGCSLHSTDKQTPAERPYFKVAFQDKQRKQRGNWNSDQLSKGIIPLLLTSQILILSLNPKRQI